MTTTAAQFRNAVAQLGIASEQAIEQVVGSETVDTAQACARLLIRHQVLTAWQARRILAGKAAKLKLGRYLLVDKLGEGGMGLVMKARDTRMDREVAIKILSPKLADNRELLVRFQREVRAAAKLDHQNIITAYDADDVGGTRFLVMQFVEGVDLRTHVGTKGPLNCESAIDCVLQAAEGLRFAHECGIVHRDVKPANLLIDNDGIVRVLDMGLARFSSPNTSEDAQLTKTDTVMGTVDYMAPEQAADTHAADARADIYSLGCTLYYLLTGLPIFEGDTLTSRLLAHQTSVPPQLPKSAVDVSPQIQTVFEELVAKSPERRLESMSVVIEKLRSCQAEAAAIRSHALDTISSAQGTVRLASTDQFPQRPLQPSPTPSGPTVVASEPEVFEETVIDSQETPTAVYVKELMTVADEKLSARIGSEKRRSRGGKSRPTSWHRSRTTVLASAIAIVVAITFCISFMRGTVPSEDDSGSTSTVAVSTNQLEIPKVDIVERVIEQVIASGGAVDLRVDGEYHLLRTQEEFDVFRERDYEIAVIASLRKSDGSWSLSDSDLQVIGKLETIPQLHLYRSDVSDFGIEYLRNLDITEELRLGKTRITDRSVPILATKQSLTFLDLYKTAITDDGIRLLAQLRELKRLRLTGMDLSDRTIESLQLAVPDCEIESGPAFRAEFSSDWINLFDGSDTSRWTTTGSFKVVDGLLVCTNGTQSAISKEKFGNFELEAEWRIGRSTNSGIFYRDSTASSRDGFEYQIADSPTDIDSESFRYETACLTGLIVSALKQKPVGQWNTSLIACRGNDIEHFLNGEPALSYNTTNYEWNKVLDQLKTPEAFENIRRHDRGHIVLQASEGKIAFRSIRIRHLRRMAVESENEVVPHTP